MEGEAVALGDGGHPLPTRAAAAQKLEQEGFDLVVGVVGEDEMRRAEPARDLREEAVARGAGDGFAHLAFCRAHFGGDAAEAEPARKSADADGIRGAAGTPAVVEVEDDGLAAVGDKGVKERDGIDAAGDGGEQRRIGQRGERGFAGMGHGAHDPGLPPVK